LRPTRTIDILWPLEQVIDEWRYFGYRDPIVQHNRLSDVVRDERPHQLPRGRLHLDRHLGSTAGSPASDRPPPICRPIALRELYDAPNNLFVAEFIGTPKMNMIDISGGVRSVDGRTIEIGSRCLCRVTYDVDILTNSAMF
jgi:hypothetical protein